MTALGGELADYSESDFGPLTDPTPVGPTEFVARTFVNAYALPVYPMPPTLAWLLRDLKAEFANARTYQPSPRCPVIVVISFLIVAAVASLILAARRPESTPAPAEFDFFTVSGGELLWTEK